MSGFAERLAALIGEGSISAFARKVGLSEALIRKYLKGAEPGLAKANQIAMGANCSLEWLATGCGYLYRQAEVVDREALLAARSLLAEQESLPPWRPNSWSGCLPITNSCAPTRRGTAFSIWPSPGSLAAAWRMPEPCCLDRRQGGVTILPSVISFQ